MIATVDPHGHPEAALVDIAALDDGLLLFDTMVDSRKVRNIRSNPRVAVVIGLDEEMCLQLEGNATVSSGEERLRYGEAYMSQFPGSRALDEHFAVVSVRINWVRSYDASTHPARSEEATWGECGPETNTETQNRS